MDPALVMTSSVSIIHLCARITILLARWTGTKQTVNKQIKAFCGEIKALSATCDALINKTRRPSMASPAQSPETLSGGLWQHMSMLVQDCENTMLLLSKILNKLSSDSMDLYQQTYQRFGESMSHGDLSRLRKRIPILDVMLASLLQLIILWVQPFSLLCRPACG